MKVSVSKENLSLGLRRVLNVVSSRTTLPVLNNVLLETTENGLALTTTDLEVCIRTTVPAVTESAGATTLPAKKFAQIVGSLPEGEIVLETDANMQTSIACQKSFFKIVGLDPNEYPRDTAVADEWGFTMAAEEFRKALAKVSYASSTDETRHVLNGILLSVRNSLLTIAATDGRRLALVEKPLTGEAIPDGDVILPPKLVSELLKTLGGEEPVTVRLSEARAGFVFGSTAITSKLVEGTYPNYRQVVPASFSRSVVIPRTAFATVLNRVAMVISESSAAVRFDLQKTALWVSASSHEFGEAKEPVEVSYEGDPIKIAFNPAFFGDPLPHLECDQIVMQFNDEYSPVSLSGDEGFLYVVMPMRV